MLPEFDPVGLRDFWLETRLEYELRDVPDGLTHTSYTAHACMTASSLFEGYLLGLWGELRGRAEEHIEWMESQPEPDRTIHLDAGVSADGWRDNLHEWRRSLGFCKWLSRGDFAFDDLTAAAAADWQVLELATPRNASRARESRRNYISIHLATAVAADAPLIGLKIFEAARVTAPMGPVTSPVRFGYWACRHLVDGGSRDEAFVARGRDMLRANLLSRFYQAGGMTEPALWLKAIYFDSGVAKTPEETIARAYDCMPGVPRPDFIPD